MSFDFWSLLVDADDAELVSFDGVEEEDDEPLGVPEAAELDEDGGVPDDEAEEDGDGDDGAVADDEEPDGDGVVDDELDVDGGDGVVVDDVDVSRWQPAAPNTSAIPSTSESLRFNIGRTSNFGYRMATTDASGSKQDRCHWRADESAERNAGKTREMSAHRRCAEVRVTTAV